MYMYCGQIWKMWTLGMMFLYEWNSSNTSYVLLILYILVIFHFIFT